MEIRVVYAALTIKFTLFSKKLNVDRKNDDDKKHVRIKILYSCQDLLSKSRGRLKKQWENETWRELQDMIKMQSSLETVPDNLDRGYCLYNIESGIIYITIAA